MKKVALVVLVGLAIVAGSMMFTSEAAARVYYGPAWCGPVVYCGPPVVYCPPPMWCAPAVKVRYAPAVRVKGYWGGCGYWGGWYR